MNRVSHLTDTQLACLRGANVNTIVCAYGNSFFVAGQAGVDYQKRHWQEYHVWQRNTCESLRKLGLLSHSPGLSLRGEYTITEAGKKAIQ